MLAQETTNQNHQIQIWHIDRLVFYARNPRKNDGAVDRMCSSIREFGSWPGGDVTAIPVILCDEWSDAQVKAFRLMVNRSVTWADFDDELLALEIGRASCRERV